MQFRPATQHDLKALATLVNRAYRGESGRQGWTTESELLAGQRTDEALLAETLAKPDSVILLAHVDDTLVGCVHLQRRGEETYLGMLTVAVEAQRGGVGDQLLAAGETHARVKNKSARIVMTVIQQRPELIAYYERRGYRATGETEAFPYGDERFGIPLRDDLKFLVFAKAL